MRHSSPRHREPQDSITVPRTVSPPPPMVRALIGPFLCCRSCLSMIALTSSHGKHHDLNAARASSVIAALSSPYSSSTALTFSSTNIAAPNKVNPLTVLTLQTHPAEPFCTPCDFGCCDIISDFLWQTSLAELTAASTFGSLVVARCPSLFTGRLVRRIRYEDSLSYLRLDELRLHYVVRLGARPRSSL